MLKTADSVSVDFGAHLVICGDVLALKSAESCREIVSFLLSWPRLHSFHLFGCKRLEIFKQTTKIQAAQVQRLKIYKFHACLFVVWLNISSRLQPKSEKLYSLGQVDKKVIILCTCPPSLAPEHLHKSLNVRHRISSFEHFVIDGGIFSLLA